MVCAGGGDRRRSGCLGETAMTCTNCGGNTHTAPHCPMSRGVRIARPTMETK
nr:MAG TPA: activity-regulated cytoskeleton associated protein 1 [Caudoviricetes sp.]